MDGVRGTVKNVVFRKVKLGQVVIYLPQEFSEAVKAFVPKIHTVYLSESEKIIKPKGIEYSKKVRETLRVHELEGKFGLNDNKHTNFYKIDNDEEPFHVQWYGGEDDVIRGHDKSSNNDNQCPKCNGFYKEDEEWLCCLVCKNWYHEECFYT